MNREEAYATEQVLDLLDTYQYPKIKEATQELRQYLMPIIESEKQKELKEKRKLKYSYGKFSPPSKTQSIIEIMSNAIKLYEEASENLEKTGRETQDLLHALELLDLSEEETIKAAQELREIRLIRREAKDFTEIMLPLYDLACKYQPIIPEFIEAHKEMQELIKYKETRQYKPRERKDLKEKFEQKELIHS